MEIYGQFIAEILADPEAGWARALGHLISTLRGDGGVVGLLHKQKCPRILFGWGRIRTVTLTDEIGNFFNGCWDNDISAPQVISATFHSPDRTICFALPHTSDELIVIIIWGQLHLRADHDELSSAFLRLLKLHPGAKSKALSPVADDGRPATREFPEGYLVCSSTAITMLHRELESISRGSFPVLVMGETGVGKEYIATLLHVWSNRSFGPFIPVNCASIPHDLWEAEMFGIGKNIATGVSPRDGYFHLAENGTLFLDEIGELPLHAQSKLLRVLQDHKVSKIGGASAKVNVRVVAATNADLRKRVKEGSFRADLYYRIAGITLSIPSLRERQEDIGLLLHHFLQRYADEAQKDIKGYTLRAFELLNKYHWPGNIRELEHEVRRLVYIAPPGEPLHAGLLSERIREPRQPEYEAEHTQVSLNLDSNLAKLERKLIKRALTQARGNRSEAARLLGITRNGLSMKMERLSVEIKQGCFDDSCLEDKWPYDSRQTVYEVGN